MTEAEWLVASDPTPMLEYVRGRGSDRKLRLLVCACCRRFCDSRGIEATQTCVEASERYADGHATEEELREARNQAHATKCYAQFRAQNTPLTLDGKVVSSRSVERPGVHDKDLRRLDFAVFAASTASGLRADIMRMFRTEPVLASSCLALFRDLLGNPFRPVAIDTSLLTSTVVSLADGIHADRAFDRLPILADALQDAGCDSAEVLDHCRGPGPHARGCWVVDLVLGKT
jgi:hypothetical protein